MADTAVANISYFVYSGKELLETFLTDTPSVATAVIIGTDIVDPQAVGSRLFVAESALPHTTQGAAPGSRKVRLAVVTTAAIAAHNTLLVQAIMPGYVKGVNEVETLPTVNVEIGAADNTTTTAELTATDAIGPTASLVKSFNGMVTAVIRLKAALPTKSQVIVTLDFGYSQSN